MRKTIQKKLEKVVQIQKIDLHNDILPRSQSMISKDIRFDSGEEEDIENEPSQSLKQLIDYHKTNKQLFLRIFGYPLDILPVAVCQMHYLQGVSILHCHLRQLPDNIAALKKLRHLFLIQNRLTELPQSLTTLKYLQYLDVSDNSMDALPVDFEQLIQLTDLYMDNNRFSTLPISVTGLKKLIRFSLAGNQLTALPDELHNWKKLNRLNLSKNKLTDLTPDFEGMTRLEWLDLSANPFRFVPTSLLNLPKIELLFLKGCQLVDLPEGFANLKNLQVLDISNNSFYNGKLPNVIFKLTSLEELIINDCGLESLSEDDLYRLKNLSIIRAQNNKIRYISRKLTKVPQLEHLMLENNPLEYFAPEIKQMNHLYQCDIAEVNQGFKKNAQKEFLDTYEPEVLAIRAKYGMDKRRTFM
jgi:Leucine-rich repeat (LRR) protein